MKVLALELSTVRGSLAWLDNNDLQLECEWPNDRKNSGAFFENLDSVTKKFGIPETLIVGLGPGSYAGTRIAISAATGLRFSSGARLIGFPSVCAMECDAHEYCVIGNARRQSFFFARVRGQELMEGPSLYSESEIKARFDRLEPAIPLFASELLPQFDRVVVRYPSALVLARVAHQPQHSFHFPPLEPIYLREPHTTMPR